MRLIPPTTIAIIKAHSRWVVAMTALVCLTNLSGCGYNNIQRADEETKSTWSEVLNQYKRRADLVPNLVSTVKGSAAYEEKVLTEVTEARAKVGQLNVNAETLNDPQMMAKFQEAQSALGSGISRLLAVAENYPQLKATEAFRDLMPQLEGTENRITVARNRYIDAVKVYNVAIRQFPANLTAKMFGYTTKATFAVENEKTISEAPAVDFTK